MADDYDYDWDDGADDYDWEGDEDDDDAEDYEEDDAADDEQLVEINDKMESLGVAPNGLIGLSGAGRQQNCGIHTIELYYPQFYFKHVELEEYDARPDRWGPSVIGKYVKGIGMVEGRHPTDDEDPVSYVLTTVHRLCDRIEREGFNETGRYTEDKKPLKIWNAVGRLDVGSESLIDRSKSIKTYAMDLFERYGDGEANIEGVDMYNACYGGQAAGLVNLSWVESDRWDGRYGFGVAVDIQDAENFILFIAGSSCAVTVFFPDAPLAHHSLRASCILHRFDFFKPVGWWTMAPIADGKYSVNAYMDCVDMCHQTLKKKLNGHSVVKSCGYNIFHTGGGFHIVKKAYDRMMRSDDPTLTTADKQVMQKQKLMPGTHILKIIGPTHTVSSFCNMSSTIMSEWEKTIGKTMVIFTYGSGSAASMYQTRFDDIPWMQVYQQWKIDFYREAIHRMPWDMGALTDTYCHVWMQFDYIPHGRTKYGINPFQAQMDAYYLMEIDPWGRRFYHRGGMAAGPRDPKWTLQADIDESRKERKDWGPMPEKPKDAKEAKQLEDKWLSIENEMLQELDPPEKRPLQIGFDRINVQHKIVCSEVIQSSAVDLSRKDEQDHTYQIVGTWSEWKQPQDMPEAGTKSYSCEVTVGENGWEEFYILQDNDFDKKIFPACPRSWKALPCVGPHKGREGFHWLLDVREDTQTPLEDIGEPGDIFRVSLDWKRSVKVVEWTKIEGKTGSFPRGRYSVSGTNNSFGFTEMADDGDGKFSLEVTLSSTTMDFYVVRNQDMGQLIYPAVKFDSESVDENTPSYGNPLTKGSSGCSVLGVGPWPKDRTTPRWSIEGRPGEVYKIFFSRNPTAPLNMSLTWEKQ